MLQTAAQRFRTMGQPKSKYNPYRVRRCVQLESLQPEDMAIFKSKSFTDTKSHDVRYHPSVDLITGACRCDCDDFRFRKAKLHPTVWSDASHICKHLRRAIANLDRRGQLPLHPRESGAVCMHCGSMSEDNYYEVCDDAGNPLPNKWTCAGCVARAQELIRSQHQGGAA